MSFKQRTTITRILLMLLTIVPATVWAYNLRGRITDATTSEGLIQASLRVLSAKDSTLVKAAVTDESGRFNIQGLKDGSYIVEASYVGCANGYRNTSPLSLSH